MKDILTYLHHNQTLRSSFRRHLHSLKRNIASRQTTNTYYTDLVHFHSNLYPLAPRVVPDLVCFQGLRELIEKCDKHYHNRKTFFDLILLIMILQNKINLLLFHRFLQLVPQLVFRLPLLVLPLGHQQLQLVPLYLDWEPLWDVGVEVGGVYP